MDELVTCAQRYKGSCEYGNPVYMYFIDLEKSYDHAAHYLDNYFKLKDLRCVPNSSKAISCLHSCFCFFFMIFHQVLYFAVPILTFV